MTFCVEERSVGGSRFFLLLKDVWRCSSEDSAAVGDLPFELGESVLTVDEANLVVGISLIK